MFMSYHPKYCTVAYVISCLLDAVDGMAARALGQPSRFGAVLDMVTDRWVSFVHVLWCGKIFYNSVHYFIRQAELARFTSFRQFSPEYPDRTIMNFDLMLIMFLISWRRQRDSPLIEAWNKSLTYNLYGPL
jgi:hypothetical protein